MGRRQTKLIIICEDVQQSAFARRYLQKRGFNRRNIRVEKNPAGKGSGEQFVRQKLIDEVKEYRRKSTYQGGITLVALIDADTKSVQERLGQINSGLEQAGLEKIRDDERIAIFVPKRNIETWLRFAENEDVDENIVYPRLEKPKKCKNAVESYINDICRNGVPQNAPSSIVHACEELAKIL